jgi:hypothetical protein
MQLVQRWNQFATGEVAGRTEEDEDAGLGRPGIGHAGAVDGKSGAVHQVAS